MNRFRARGRAARVALGAALAVVLLVAGTAAVARTSDDRGGGGVKTERLFLSGHVDGLYPSTSATLPVRIESRFNFAVVITTLDVTAGDAAGCPATTLAITPASTGQTIAAHGATTVAVRIAMTPEAPDTCQGATLPLHYAATLRRA